jgi:hypothetical protein
MAMTTTGVTPKSHKNKKYGKRQIQENETHNNWIKRLPAGAQAAEQKSHRRGDAFRRETGSDPQYARLLVATVFFHPPRPAARSPALAV